MPTTLRHRHPFGDSSHEIWAMPEQCARWSWKVGPMKADLTTSVLVSIVVVAICVTMLGIWAPAQVVNIVVPLLGFGGLAMTQLMVANAQSRAQEEAARSTQEKISEAVAKSRQAVVEVGQRGVEAMDKMDKKINSNQEDLVKRVEAAAYARGLEDERRRIKSPGEVAGAIIDKQNLGNNPNA